MDRKVTSIIGDFGWLELCLSGIRELAWSRPIRTQYLDWSGPMRVDHQVLPESPLQVVTPFLLAQTWPWKYFIFNENILYLMKIFQWFLFYLVKNIWRLNWPGWEAPGCQPTPPGSAQLRWCPSRPSSACWPPPGTASCSTPTSGTAMIAQSETYNAINWSWYPDILISSLSN